MDTPPLRTDPTFTPAPVIQWGIAPANNTPIWWGPQYYESAQIVMQQVGNAIVEVFTNPGLPSFGPQPRPRKANGELMIPGLIDGETDPTIRLPEGTNPAVVAAWDNVMTAVWALVRVYGELLPDPAPAA